MKLNTILPLMVGLAWSSRALPQGAALGEARPLPKVVDWQKAGRVTSPYELTDCFSGPQVGLAVALSSNIAIREGKAPVRPSPQQLIDCADTCGCGCNLTVLTSDLHYASRTPLVNNSVYPQLEHVGKCQKAKVAKYPLAKVTSFSHHTNIRPHALMRELTKGPVLARVDAAPFQLYEQGVFNGHGCTNTPDDMIVVVGYNDEARVPYWKLLINFGPDFGEGGYLLLRKTEHNLCGLYNNITRVEGALV